MARITQYAEFVLESKSVTAQVIAASIGLQPDAIAVAGSRTVGDQQVPRLHSWTIKSGISEKFRLDDHFEAILTRLQPYAARIAAVTAEGHVIAVLAVVRRYEAGPEEPQVLQARAVEGYEVLRGQHPLVGFGVDRDLVRFLAATGAAISVDEYADEYE